MCQLVWSALRAHILHLRLEQLSRRVLMGQLVRGSLMIGDTVVRIGSDSTIQRLALSR